MSELVKVVRTIRGRPDQVRNAVDTARLQGRLVDMVSAKRLSADVVEVRVRMLEPLTPESLGFSPVYASSHRPTMVPWFRRRPKLAATIAGLVLGVVGFLAYLVYQLVVLIMAHLAAVLTVAALAVIVLLGAAHSLTKAAGCCPCHRR